MIVRHCIHRRNEIVELVRSALAATLEDFLWKVHKFIREGTPATCILGN